MTGWLGPPLMSDQEVAEKVAALCAWLRAARRAKDLSIRAVAAGASVSPFTVTRVEAGDVVPSWDTYAKLANASGCVVSVRDRLLGEVAPPLRGISATREKRDPDWEAWLQLATVGSELNWARHMAFMNHEITEAEAARLLGMSRTTVHAIEHSTGNPLLSSVVRLADLTGREVVLLPA